MLIFYDQRRVHLAQNNVQWLLLTNYDDINTRTGP